MKKLILFGPNRLSDMVKKGNLSYLRHYETFFDDVRAVYLFGSTPHEVKLGRVSCVSVGGRFRWFDLLVSPFRLYFYVRKNSPAMLLTGDQVFLWWTGLLVRWLLRTRIVLMPVCMPEKMYKNHHVTLFSLPIRVQRWCVRASYRSASRVFTADSCGEYVPWLQGDPLAKNKLIVTRTLVEGLPSMEFLHAAGEIVKEERAGDETFVLTYVGRLHAEKLIGDLIGMMREIAARGYGEKVRLRLIGDGPERNRLETMAAESGIDKAIDFIGTVDNEELPGYLASSHAFVSTITGTSLREAALCRLPLVAYDCDWIQGMLEHEKTALLVAPGDVEGLASQVIRLVEDRELRQHLEQNIYDLARSLWTPDHLEESLREVYDTVTA